MKINLISFNVNGIRAAMRKGMVEWIEENDFDIICIQELKAQQEQLDLYAFEKLGYQIAISEAEKRGYSGVAILSKLKFQNIHIYNGLGSALYYNEGRYLQADFEDFSVINCYFPSGSAGDHRQSVKMDFLEHYYSHFKNLHQTERKLIICGDFNICHKEIDIHDPKGNKDRSGFKPEERKWMDEYFKLGFIDCFRQFHSEKDRYTWWSLRSGARERNKGWRIDYITVNQSLKQELVDCDLLGNVIFSDHCPVYLSFNV